MCMCMGMYMLVCVPCVQVCMCDYLCVYVFVCVHECVCLFICLCVFRVYKCVCACAYVRVAVRASFCRV